MCGERLVLEWDVLSFPAEACVVAACFLHVTSYRSIFKLTSTVIHHTLVKAELLLYSTQNIGLMNYAPSSRGKQTYPVYRISKIFFLHRIRSKRIE